MSYLPWLAGGAVLGLAAKGREGVSPSDAVCIFARHLTGTGVPFNAPRSGLSEARYIYVMGAPTEEGETHFIRMGAWAVLIREPGAARSVAAASFPKKKDAKREAARLRAKGINVVGINQAKGRTPVVKHRRPVIYKVRLARHHPVYARSEADLDLPLEAMSVDDVEQAAAALVNRLRGAGRPAKRRLGHNEVVRMLRRRLAQHGIYALQQGDAPDSIYLHLYADVYGDVTAPWNPAWKDQYWDEKAVTREAGWDDVGDKIRISDHRQPRGGGYSMGRGERHGRTEWSIDPSTTLEGFPQRTQQERIDEIVEEAVEALQDAREEA